SFGPNALADACSWADLRKWWLVHHEKANTPNWDIAMACEIERSPGLILVEAKANLPELSKAGKAPERRASSKSLENRERIGAALAEASEGLKPFAPSIKLRIDSHYQLSNRLAFAWKLASLGVPTVLVYLGFWGDTGIANT